MTADPTDADASAVAREGPTPPGLVGLAPQFLALFLAMIGFGLALPVLPVFVERLGIAQGAPASRVAIHVGALTSAYALGQMVCAPLWGRWSDRHGRTRKVVVIGLVGVGVSHMVFGLGTSLPILYGARLAGGAFASGVVVVATSVIADAVPSGLRGRAMAWQGTAVSLGFVVGPVLGGLLGQIRWHVALPSRHVVFDGFSVPFFAAAGLALLAVPVVARGVEPVSRGRTGGTPTPRGWSELTRKLGPVLLLVLVAQAALTLFEAALALHANGALGFGLGEIAALFAVCGLAMAVSQGGIVGWLSGRITSETQLAVGFGALGGSLLVLPFLVRFTTVLGIVALLAFGVALVTPNLLTLAADRSETLTGTGLGLLNTAAGVGQVTGPLVGGALYGWSSDLPFLLAGFTALGAATGVRRLLGVGAPQSLGVPT